MAAIVDPAGIWPGGGKGSGGRLRVSVQVAEVADGWAGTDVVGGGCVGRAAMARSLTRDEEALHDVARTAPATRTSRTRSIGPPPCGAAHRRSTRPPRAPRR